MSTHKIYTKGETTFIERLEYPRFKAEILFDANIAIGDIGTPVWIDTEPSAAEFMVIARVMGEAGDFIANYNSRG